MFSSTTSTEPATASETTRRTLISLPNELFLMAKDLLGPVGLLSHAAYSTLYDSEPGTESEGFWARLCLRNGLSRTAQEVASQIQAGWWQIAVQYATHAWKCQHQACGIAALIENREYIYYVHTKSHLRYLLYICAGNPVDRALGDWKGYWDVESRTIPERTQDDTSRGFCVLPHESFFHIALQAPTRTRQVLGRTMSLTTSVTGRTSARPAKMSIRRHPAGRSFV